ncbi:MAG TPA: TIGR03435 family protein [Terracidiphilus sp.]|nr:TIGR03435 family protein [Terracidiphilus sp.]
MALVLGTTGNLVSSQTPAAAPQAPAASAQDIVGVWQGTLHIAQNNSDLRIVNKITKDDKGALKVIDYSIDQGGTPLAASKASFDGGVLKYSIELISGTYEGKMSADGKNIAGMWSQGPNSLALNLVRTTPDTAWPIPEPPKTMAADADPSLEVATIKPSEPGRQGKGFGYRGTQFVTFNTNMNDLIAFAYGLHAKQIIGAPDWFGTDLFDIDGKPDVPGRPSIQQMESMMRKLLTDRCALKFHHEQKELSVYAVRLGNGGPKMSKTTAGPNDPQGFGFRGLGDLGVRNLTMAEFATWMQSSVMDKPVMDQTGLKDKYDFTLKWTPDDSQFAQFRGAVAPAPQPAGENPNAPPSLYTAVQEQLGLKIEATKAPDDVIVIDHVEKPSPN